MDDPLRLLVRPELEEPALVLAFDGWNDAGESATHAARFLSETLGLVPVAEIDPEEYYDFTVRRPTVSLDAAGVRQIEWPCFEFRFAQLPDRPGLVVGVGGEPHLRWRDFCGQVLRLVRELRVRRVVLLGAYLADVLYSLPVRVSGFASDAEWMQRLGLEPTGYEGPTGIVGVLADRLREDGLELVSLWAGLPHYITTTPNPRGSLALLQKVATLLELPLDLEPLRVESAEFEERISELVAADPALAEYVKELKRRGFAQ